MPADRTRTIERTKDRVFLIVRKVRESVIEFLVLGLILWFMGVYRLFGNPDDPVAKDSEEVIPPNFEMGLGDEIDKILREQGSRHGWPH